MQGRGEVGTVMPSERTLLAADRQAAQDMDRGVMAAKASHRIKREVSSVAWCISEGDSGHRAGPVLGAQCA